MLLTRHARAGRSGSGLSHSGHASRWKQSPLPQSIASGGGEALGPCCNGFSVKNRRDFNRLYIDRGWAAGREMVSSGAGCDGGATQTAGAASRCVPCGNTPYTGSSGAGCDGGAAQTAGAAFRCVPCGNTPYTGSGGAGGWRSRPGGRCCFPVRSLREHTLRGFQQRGVGWQAARCVRRANAPYAGSGGAGAMVKPPRRGVPTAGN